MRHISRHLHLQIGAQHARHAQQNSPFPARRRCLWTTQACSAQENEVCGDSHILETCYLGRFSQLGIASIGLP